MLEILGHSPLGPAGYAYGINLPRFLILLEQASMLHLKKTQWQNVTYANAIVITSQHT